MTISQDVEEEENEYKFQNCIYIISCDISRAKIDKSGQSYNKTSTKIFHGGLERE